MFIVWNIIGAFCISLSVALLILVFKQFKIIYSVQNDYNKKLKKILSKYDSAIIRVNKLYVNKKYNMSYVDSFKELLDVYYKKNTMISFKEVKRGSEGVFLIIEDNPYGELRFGGEEVPTMKSLDAEGRVIYAGSFSKILSPGLRVGFAVAAKPVLEKIENPTLVINGELDKQTPLYMAKKINRQINEEI